MIGKPKLIKAINSQIIEDYIRTKGKTTKPEISAQTKISSVTINKIVDSLVQQGKLVSSGFEETNYGRPAQIFSIANDYRYILSLFYYQKTFYYAIFDNCGQQIDGQQKMAFQLSHEDNATQRIKILIRDIIDKYNNINISDIVIAVPGVVLDGTVHNIPQLKDWENVDLLHELKESFDQNIFIENDLNVMATEAKQLVSDSNFSLVLLYLEENIGSSIIIDNKAYKGYSGFAGELGSLLTDIFGIEEINFEEAVSKLFNALKNDRNDNSALKNEFIKIVVFAIMSFICTINPEVVLIICSQLTEDDLQSIRVKIGNYLDSVHMPKIQFSNTFIADGLIGGFKLALESERISIS